MIDSAYFREIEARSPIRGMPKFKTGDAVKYILPAGFAVGKVGVVDYYNWDKSLKIYKYSVKVDGVGCNLFWFEDWMEGV